MNCKGCGKCCQMLDPFLDVEIKYYEGVEYYLTETRNGKRWMKRKENGDCIAFNDKRECDIYNHRPEECRDFDQMHPVCRKITGRD